MKKKPQKENMKSLVWILRQNIIMYGLPSPHKSESSSAYDKKGDKNRCGCKLFMRVYFSITRKQVIQGERMRKKNETENEWGCVQVTHASYTINVPLNNFNIHQPNKEAIHMIGYQYYNESHQRWS